jgi:trk system potassium uptake protein TrkA
MKVIIMGCGRVGARLAAMLDEAGHDVTVLDSDTYSFRRLPSSFGGTALFGNGMKPTSSWRSPRAITATSWPAR